ncbi:MAG TPA: class III poly(R)-hydroxyalkanoic acid synthase subunit PhaC [Steroidobacteraceae bacterium]|nr:class III poly(R)-hydroxyalkanoic acid synthase subunit PhaC [Steroidobacteraceae bacterium]
MNAAPDSLARLLEGAAAMQERGRSVLRSMQGLGEIAVGTSEKRCVYSEDKIRLYRYAPLARSANLKPLLICYAMVNRPYLLDLQPDRSFIRELLHAGLDVYLLDWGYPDGADRFSGFDEYVDGYLRRCVEFVLKEHAMDSLTLLGVCQGGTMSLCYAALAPKQIAQLITMVTPVDFKTPENLLSKWAQHIDVGLLTQSGNVSGDFLNLVYLSLMPFRLTQQKYVNLLQMQGDRVQLENFMRMEKWIFDSPDQPAAAFRDFIQWFFQENRLIRDELTLAGNAVRLKTITAPVLNIFASKDHLVPPSASIPLGAHIGSKDYEALEIDAGHIGLYVGGKTRKSVPAAVMAWLRKRN